MTVHVKRTENHLQHHGVKGMKWGIRRYQKRNGQLTKLGKKRVEEGANLFPKYKGKTLKVNDSRSANRDSVINEIGSEKSKRLQTEYQRYVKKHPTFEKSDENPYDYWKYNIRDKSKDAEETRRLTKSFIDKYSTATLKDLEIGITPETKKYAEEMVRRNRAYEGIV